MGVGGAAMAVAVADTVLMTENLLRIPAVIAHGRFVRALILENVILSIVLKLLAISLALAGILELWTAILFDIGSLVFVVSNGTRALLTKRTFTAEAESGPEVVPEEPKSGNAEEVQESSAPMPVEARQSFIDRATFAGHEADGFRGSVFSSLLITEETGAVEMKEENVDEPRMSLVGEPLLSQARGSLFALPTF
jgi:hypothetical protein